MPKRQLESASPARSPEPDLEAEAEAASPPAGPSSAPPAPRPKKRKTTKAKPPTPGIVYISRLPPGLTVPKIRHLMGRWGDVGRVYAQRRDAPGDAAAPKPGGGGGPSRRKERRGGGSDFTEAWVEFADKSVGKMVAGMLNAQVIGGKKGDRWRDDIWTMKYLSGFKWEMLGEQVAYEKQAHQARLRNEISRARTEQAEYLKNVELARVLDKRAAKRVEAGTGVGAAAEEGAGPERATGAKGLDIGKGGVAAMGGKEGKRLDVAKEGKGTRKYRQREAAPSLTGQGIDSVLGSVFG
ncbi:RNA-binding ATPase activator esf2 [Cryptotrichosporon argae]